MGTSLKDQKTVLKGNEDILTGVTETLDQQRNQVEKLVRIDLSRSQLTGITVSIPITDKGDLDGIRKTFYQALLVNIGRNESKSCDQVSPSGDCLILPFQIDECFKFDLGRTTCNLRMEDQQNGRFVTNALFPDGMTMSIETSEDVWTNLKRISATIMCDVTLFDDAEQTIFSINPESAINKIALTKSGLTVELRNLKLNLDQILSTQVYFKTSVVDRTPPARIHLFSTDPRVFLDQDFGIQWRASGRKVSVENRLTGTHAVRDEVVSQKFKLRTRFKGI